MKTATKYEVRYPWARWFKLRKFTIKKGRDFACSLESMEQQIRNRIYRWNERNKHDKLASSVDFDEAKGEMMVVFTPKPNEE